MRLLLAITYILLGISFLCAFYFFRHVLETSDKIAIIVPPAIAAIYAHLQCLYYRNEERRHKKEGAFGDFEKRFKDLIESKNSVGYEQKTDSVSWFRIPNISIGKFRISPFKILRDSIYESKSGVIAFQDEAISIFTKHLEISGKGRIPEILSNVVDGCSAYPCDYAAIFRSPSTNITPSMTRGMSL